MDDVSDAFLEGTTEADASTLVARPDNLPLVVLVVDDSEDDELVAAIAEARMAPAVGYHGGWGSLVKGGPDGFQLTLKFILRRDGWVRQWTLPDVTQEMLRAICDSVHHVAVLPREVAGDFTESLELPRIAGAIIVEAQASDGVRKGSLPFLGG